MLDAYDVEVEQLDDERVVLAIPVLRLIVLGRTLDEAQGWACAAIAFREQQIGRGSARMSAAVSEIDEAVDPTSPPASHAA